MTFLLRVPDFPGGIYTYEKHFTVPEEWKDRDVLVEFEGVYKNAAVFLNGTQLAFHAYGYTGFFVELEGVDYGRENILTVTADNSKLPNSRWYSGSGIYRLVWLHVCEKGGLRPESVRITTIGSNPAVIRVESPVPVKAEVEGLADEGTDVELVFPGAKLWSAGEPYLYKARITAGENDSTEILFGIRRIEWSGKGLFINGKETLLRGGCIHHDNGILGAATYDESEERRIRIMKENGFNAIRSSHNAQIELYLNGRSVGKKRLKECRAVFHVRYKPGILTAVARDSSGKETGRSRISSAKGPFTLAVHPEKTALKPEEVLYIPVNVEGSNHLVESNADRKITVHVEGGELLAFGSANPCTEEEYHTGTFSSYFGKALAVVRAGRCGKMRVTADDGRSQTEAVIQIANTDADSTRKGERSCREGKSG